MSAARLADIYLDVTQRHAWETVQRASGDETTDEAWESYLRFVRTIFGVTPARSPSQVST